MNDYIERIEKLHKELQKTNIALLELSREASFFAKIIVDLCEKYPNVREDVVGIMSGTCAEEEVFKIES